MKLEGSLDAFGLSDIFALLAGTAKSGGLRLRGTASPDSGSVNGVVWLHDGKITGATSDVTHLGLVRRLIGSGAVDDVGLATAVERATRSPVGVARALLEAGAVEPELLREAAVDQAVDAVFDLTRWVRGDFGFDPGAHNADDVGIALEHGWLIAEAHARRQAWEDMRSMLPADDTVVTMPTTAVVDPVVSADEWALLSLVDGRRSLGDLVPLTGVSPFAIATVLTGLMRRGLLVVGDGQDHATVVKRRLAILAPLESSTIGDVSVAPAVPEPAAAPEHSPTPGFVAVRPESAMYQSQAEPARVTETGLSAVQALAAARAVQGLPPAVAPAARRTDDVIPPRHEPFLPQRRPTHPEPAVAASAFASAYTSAAFGAAAESAAASRASANERGSATSFGMSIPTTLGNTATIAELATVADPQQIIERDPGLNRSLLLRLIAGVRGL